MRQFFYTEYRLSHPNYSDGVKYGNYVLADTQDEAEQLCELRGLGEWVVSGPVRPGLHPIKIITPLPELLDRVVSAYHKEQPFLQHAHKLAHATFHVLDIATRSERYRPPHNVYGDLGLVHSLYHLLMDSRDLVQDIIVIPTLRPTLEAITASVPEMFLTPQERQTLHKLRQDSDAVAD